MKASRLKIVACLLVTAVFCAPANAQIAGSRLNKVADKRDAGKVMAEFIGCMVDIEGRWSRAFLETLPGSRAEKAMSAQINGDRFSRCLVSDRLVMDNRELGMSEKALRGALAEYHVRSVFRTKAAEDAAPEGASAWLMARLASRAPAEPLDRPTLIAHDFAACVVDRRWSDSRSFVGTVAGSTAERAALKGLAATFPACLQQGATMRLDAALLRVTIAEALYHSLAPRGPVAGAKPGAGSR